MKWRFSHRGKRPIFLAARCEHILRRIGYETGFSSCGVVGGFGHYVAAGGICHAYHGGVPAALVVFGVGCSYSSDGGFWSYQY